MFDGLLVEPERPLLARRPDHEEAGGDDRGGRRRAGPAEEPPDGYALPRRSGVVEPQIRQVIAEDGAGNRRNGGDLEHEPRRQLAAERVVDERDQVADERRRGGEDRHVHEPPPHVRPPLRRILRDAAGGYGREIREDRKRDDERRERPAECLAVPDGIALRRIRERAIDR